MLTHMPCAPLDSDHHAAVPVRADSFRTSRVPTPLAPIVPMHLDTDVAVIGGGVAGLTVACQLAAAGQRVTLFEARSRLGGRVVTATAAPLVDTPWLDLGPAWFWPHQQHIRALVAHFGLSVFEQHRAGLAMYDAGDGRAPQPFDASGQTARSYRVVGGMGALVQALVTASQTGPHPVTVHRDAAIRTLTRHDDGVVLNGDGFHCTAGRVIVAAPPRVVARDIKFAPPLADRVVETLRSTVTWMAHAMKCVVTYDAPFWREAGRSGYAISWGGPLQEIHDACVPGHDRPTPDRHPAGYALMGFVAPPTGVAAQGFRAANREERRAAVLSQLVRLFGDRAQRPVDYAEYDWSRETQTCGQDDALPPGAHPEYGHPLFEGGAAGDSWQGRLVWAGADTVADGGGYLDGAVASARRAAATVLALRTAT